MCGIVGVVGTTNKVTMDVFHNMLQVDVIRGMDSTGVMAAFNSHYKIIKGAVLPQYLIYSANYIEKVVNHKEWPIALIGHNRAATKGDVVFENSHPFDHGDIVMVHNGTVHNHKSLSFQSDVDFDTDSEAICWAIAKDGIEKVWSKLSGAATLVWWHKKERALYMITNGKRPLCYAYTKDRERVFFASESWMIKALCERSSIALEVDDTGAAVFSPSADHLFRFEFPGKGKKFEEEVVTKLSPFFAPIVRPTTVVESSQGWHDYHQSSQDGEAKKDKGKVTHLYPVQNRTIVKNNPAPSCDTDPHLRTRQILNVDEFLKQYQNCCFCQKDLDESDHHGSVVIDVANVCCEHCANFCETQLGAIPQST